MIRVYFDWNVLSALKNPIAKTIQDINELLISNVDSILIPYSPAHIQDLQKGADDPNNLELIKKDLDFIDEITHLQCIQFDLKKNSTEPTIGSSHWIFESNKNSDFDIISNPEKIDKLFSDTIFPSLGKLLKKQWQLTPTNIDFKEQSKYPDAKKIYDKYFKRTMADDNMYNFMLDFSEFFKEMNKNPEIYKGLVDAFRKYMGIDPKEISNLKNPYEDLDEIFKNSKIDISFNKIINPEYKEKNEILESIFTKFTNEYAVLDMSGYRPDSLNKKNLYSNFTNDAHHAFYGAHCDYFVSHERKLLEKSKVIYKKYEIETKALTPSEFIDDISNFPLKTYDFKYLLESINYTLDNDFVDVIEDKDGKERNILLFRPKYPILAYFNFLYYQKDKNNRMKISMRHVHKNFSRFSFYYEIESIVNKCVSIFGSDGNYKDKFTVEERKPFSENKWQGRIWLSDIFLIGLIQDRLQAGVQLVFEEITDEYLQEIKK